MYLSTKKWQLALRPWLSDLVHVQSLAGVIHWWSIGFKCCATAGYLRNHTAGCVCTVFCVARAYKPIEGKICSISSVFASASRSCSTVVDLRVGRPAMTTERLCNYANRTVSLVKCTVDFIVGSMWFTFVVVTAAAAVILSQHPWCCDSSRDTIAASVMLWQQPWHWQQPWCCGSIRDAMTGDSRHAVAAAVILWQQPWHFDSSRDTGSSRNAITVWLWKQAWDCQLPWCFGRSRDALAADVML